MIKNLRATLFKLDFHSCLFADIDAVHLSTASTGASSEFFNLIFKALSFISKRKIHKTHGLIPGMYCNNFN